MRGSTSAARAARPVSTMEPDPEGPGPLSVVADRLAGAMSFSLADLDLVHLDVGPDVGRGVGSPGGVDREVGRFIRLRSRRRRARARPPPGRGRVRRRWTG